LLWDYDFVNSTEVYYEDGSSIRFFPSGTERHFIHNIIFSNYIYENEIMYTTQTANKNTRRRTTEDDRKKMMKKNEKKLLKD
jgi:hypothetical protein